MSFNKALFRRAGMLLVLAASGGCLISEYEANEATCGPFDSKEDGQRCRCNIECKSFKHGGFCFGEADFGYAHGYCSHKCTDDADCGDGFMCFQNNCMARCKSTRECEPTRECGLPGNKPYSGCVAYCNEASDCESGNCDHYTGLCLPPGKTREGAGLDAKCSEDAECRSNTCIEGRCRKVCLSKTQSCPEDAVCEARGGYCQSKPRKSAPDADDAGLTCTDEDASASCSP